MSTVLLIEDEAMLRANVVRALARVPSLQVLDAGSLEEALRHLDATPPDLVVSDIDLPRRTGLEILGELAARRLRIPVIFVTGYLRAYGAQIPRNQDVDVMEKPVSMDDLRAAVERRLRPQHSVRPPAPFGVPDYMQLAGMGRHSVLIEVSRDRRTVGTVAMVRGEAWSAVDQSGTGSEALRRLVFASDSLVSCRSLAGDPPERNLDGSWEWVLLEAARAHDEAGDEPPKADDDDDPVRSMVDVAAPSGEVLRPPPAARFESRTDATGTFARDVAAPRTNDYANRAFERAWEEGVAALLKKDYPTAMDAFCVAREFRPDDVKVRSNIDRLVQLGVPMPDKVHESKEAIG